MTPLCTMQYYDNQGGPPKNWGTKKCVNLWQNRKKKEGRGGGSFWTMFKNVQNWYIGSSFIIIEVKEKYSLVLLWGRGGGANFFFPFPGWEQLSLAFLHIHQSLLYTMLLHCTCCELWTKTLITLSVTFSLAKLCFRFSFQKWFHLPETAKLKWVRSLVWRCQFISSWSILFNNIGKPKYTH